MNSIKQQLQELTGLIYELNESDRNRTWNLDICGSVKSVSVYYFPVKKERCECCGESTIRATHLTIGTRFRDLEPLIEEVRGYLE